MQKSDENEDKCKKGDYQLIQYRILRTSTIRIVWQTVKRITSEILGVKTVKLLI